MYESFSSGNVNKNARDLCHVYDLVFQLSDDFVVVSVKLQTK